MTKFPGGGLRHGEGLADCVKREFREELNKEVEIVKHLYTTDFYQQSAFNEDEQLISVYYLVDAKTCDDIVVTNANALDNTSEGTQSFRWKLLQDLLEEELTFPVDKKMVKILKREIL